MLLANSGAIGWRLPWLREGTDHPNINNSQCSVASTPARPHSRATHTTSTQPTQPGQLQPYKLPRLPRPGLYLFTHTPCTPHLFISKYNYRQRPQSGKKGGTVTSGKWPPAFLRPFRGSPVAQFHCHTWTSRAQSAECRLDACHQSGPRSEQAAGLTVHSVSAGLGRGWTSSRLSQSRSVCVAGAACAGVHVHVRLTLTLTLTLRPQHAPSRTWHRASVRQLCNCNCALALHLHPGGSTPTLCYPSTSKTRSVRPACTAHKHTSVQSARPSSPSSSPSILIFLGAGHSLAIPPLQH